MIVDGVEFSVLAPLLLSQVATPGYQPMRRPPSRPGTGLDTKVNIVLRMWTRWIRKSNRGRPDGAFLSVPKIASASIELAPGNDHIKSMTTFGRQKKYLVVSASLLTRL